MLHWLAGQRPPEGTADTHGNEHAEPPETPAPVFAVRAFKHAIFGTPASAQPRPRRNSHSERERPRAVVRPSRPVLTRPKSTGDAPTAKPEEMPPSPTKGILLTPGTIGGRGKSVKFGELVIDNEGRKTVGDVKLTLPEELASKPSNIRTKGADQTETRRGRSKLTEQFEMVREESAKRSKCGCEGEGELASGDVATDAEEPTCAQGKYWKHEYDIYRENTSREVRKLITKQKSAKGFARDKDVQCTQLADDLRQERKKVDKLEKKAIELEAQIQALQLRILQKSDLDAAVPSMSLKTSNVDSKDKATEPSSALLPDNLQQATMNTDELSRSAKPMSRRSRTRPSSDLKSETLVPRHKPALNTDRPQHPLPSPPSGQEPGRAVTSGTDMTPLVSLNVNTLPDLHTFDINPPAEQTSLPPVPTIENESRASYKKERHDSLDPSQPQPKRPTHAAGTERQRSPIRSSPPIIESSPELYRPKSAALTSMQTPALANSQAPTQAIAPRTEAKENIAPATRTSPTLVKAVPQPAAGGKRIVSREGVEIGADRIAAARARLDARRQQQRLGTVN